MPFLKESVCLAHSHYVISGGYPPIVIASKIQKLYKRFDFGQG